MSGWLKFAAGIAAVFSMFAIAVPVGLTGARAQVFQVCEGLNANQNVGPTGPGGTPVVDIALNPGDQLNVVVTANAGVQTTLSGPFLNNPSFDGSGNVSFTQGQGSGQFIGSLIAVVTGGTANIVVTCTPGNGDDTGDLTGVVAAINEANANTQELVNNAGAANIARTIPVQINVHKFVSIETKISNLRKVITQQFDAFKEAEANLERVEGLRRSLSEQEATAIFSRDRIRESLISQVARYRDFLGTNLQLMAFLTPEQAQAKIDTLVLEFSKLEDNEARRAVLDKVFAGNKQFENESEAAKTYVVRRVNDLLFQRQEQEDNEQLFKDRMADFEQRKEELNLEKVLPAAQRDFLEAKRALRRSDDALADLLLEFEQQEFRGSRQNVNNFVPGGVRLNMGDTGNRRQLNFGWSLGGLRQSMVAIRRAELAALGVSGDGTSHVETKLPELLADERLNAWVEGSYSYTDDQRTGGEAESNQFNIDGGVMYRAFQQASFGGKVRYRATRSKRDDGSQRSEADAYGAALFAQIGLPGGANLTPLLAYERSNTNLVLSAGGASVTSDFDTDVYTLGATISREFDLGNFGTKHQFYIDPNASLSHVTAVRQAHTRSDNSAVAGARVVQGTLTFGPTFGARIAKPFDGVRSMTPTLGLNGIWNFRDGGDSVTANGTVIEAVRFSGSLSAGLTTSFNNGASVSVTTSYSGIGSDVRGYALTLRGSIAF